MLRLYQQLLLSAFAASQKRAWLHRSCLAGPTMIAVEPKVVEDVCFAHQTGQQTWKVHLFSGTWFLRHSVTRITYPDCCRRVSESQYSRRAMQVSRTHPCRRKRVTEMERMLL